VAENATSHYSKLERMITRQIAGSNLAKKGKSEKLTREANNGFFGVLKVS